MTLQMPGDAVFATFIVYLLPVVRGPKPVRGMCSSKFPYVFLDLLLADANGSFVPSLKVLALPLPLPNDGEASGLITVASLAFAF